MSMVKHKDFIKWMLATLTLVCLQSGYAESDARNGAVVEKVILRVLRDDKIASFVFCLGMDGKLLVTAGVNGHEDEISIDEPVRKRIFKLAAKQFAEKDEEFSYVDQFGDYEVKIVSNKKERLFKLVKDKSKPHIPDDLKELLVLMAGLTKW